ncbi:MAG TPA: hypothetical protein ENG63_03495 [Candidatus Desulfofervidus auxilii]|uniref:Uncharacterized protein n=1 Tax=Desulfofervidus auxilii TaxID=1621989 RepID=A0A7C0Y6M3_DESA2|nr:hypothetical protein [Candidatus Desulfofervidus auxilii]
MWENKAYYQGVSAIYKDGIEVAETKRWHIVIVHEPKLFLECPFNKFKDGFYFKHPSGSPCIVNKGATPITADLKEAVRKKIEKGEKPPYIFQVSNTINERR